MTWAKLGDEFPDDCAATPLSDAAFRLHVEGICWVMKRESGGFIRRHELRRLTALNDPEPALRELLDGGFWAVVDDPSGWQVKHHMSHQRTPEQIAQDRERHAARQRRYAERKRQEASRD